MQAVTTGAYRAVEYIKANIKLEGAEKASSRTARRWWRSAPSTRRRVCSTSSSPSSSLRLPSRSLSRSSYRLSDLIAVFGSTRRSSWPMRRRMGQCEEGGRGRPETEGYASARCLRDRRHRWRSLQGHFVGGIEPRDQVHDAVRIACCRVGRDAHCEELRACGVSGCRIFPGVGVLRAQILYGMRIETRKATDSCLMN